MNGNPNNKNGSYILMGLRRKIQGWKGGILINPDGINEIKFAWGLGRKNNN